ncbi:phosphatidylinositol glycan, class F [Planoprotostelium fungivorum]|uniref:Phosphatidylinositol glycan, class F n=1 Tax=Planoprotostelium fungivorum TaxID=1890364 RepID=A0A2P6NTT6_9EUKA|nr:phosphatidylinositol glycan, class F [Planoprotostelium fungivorum]
MKARPTEASFLLLLSSIVAFSLPYQFGWDLFQPDQTVTFVGTFVGIFVFHFIGIIYGASCLDHFLNTLSWACLHSIYISLPLSFAHQFSSEAYYNIVHNFFRPTTHVERSVSFPIIGATIGSWIGALPIPLDWDRPWQQWPISCVIGCVVGHSCGVLIAIIASRYKSQGMHL